MCCGLCCKEFKGWCRAFTKTERALTVVEAILLLVLIAFLIFLILHLLACSTPELKHEEHDDETYDIEEPDYEEKKKPIGSIKQTTIIYNQTEINRATNWSNKAETKMVKHKTIDLSLECSWTPSAKTTALTRYYEQNGVQTYKAMNNYANAKAEPVTPSTTTAKTYTIPRYKVDFIDEDQSDGEDAEPLQKQLILSLVKLQPPQRVVFGCILSVIHRFHALTSASCIEAIEEVDSLDSFVIMERYGTPDSGGIRSIADLQIHPFYQGSNRSHDLAVLRSQSALPGPPARLPAPLDAALLSLGERFRILGFGPYRSMDSRVGDSGRGLRQVWVYRVGGAQCAAGAWALRHLEAGRGAARGGAGAGAGGALCAGALWARGLPCNYCSGTPLLRGRLLLGVLSDEQQCGVACEPQLYVSLAQHRDWLDGLLRRHTITL